MDLFDGLPPFPYRQPQPRERRPPTDDDPGCVEWWSVHCPRCGSGDCPTIDSHSVPMRRHACRKCGNNFKSIEMNYHPE